MRFGKALVVCSLLLLLVAGALAQNNFVSNANMVPVPGVGHDYLRDLNEIINPMNGSLSVRIEAPRPKERGLNYPFFAFIYDSTQQFGLTYSERTTNQSYCCGPDSAGDGSGGNPPDAARIITDVSFPFQSVSYPLGTQQVLSGPNSVLSNSGGYSRWVGGAQYQSCNFYSGYAYEDPYGVIHDLGVHLTWGPPGYGCTYLGVQEGPIGGDEQYKIVVADGVWGIAKNMMIDTHGNSVWNGSPMIEDTNGNFVNGTGRTGTYQSFQPWGDALAVPKTASRTFAGGATYSYTW